MPIDTYDAVRDYYTDFPEIMCALQPFVVPLSHAGLRARSLAIAGAPTLARATAEQGMAFHMRAAMSPSRCRCFQ